jgi:[ribosomal protein S5]-alanine N-acetyltransferase
MKIMLETPRLILREMNEGDSDALWELDSDPEVHRYLGNKPVQSKDEIKKQIENSLRQYKENGIGRWAAIEKESGNFIGWTGLKLVKNETNKHVNYYDLGYRFIRKYWGKGYAFETALASIKHAFITMQLKEIYAMADIKNLASNKVLQKSGLKFIETFNFDGVQHNWYHLFKEEWKKQA